MSDQTAPWISDPTMHVDVPAFLVRGNAHVGAPLLVFLHGIGGGKSVFSAQLEHFGARGYRAASWDMPGYGESATIDPYTMDAAAASLARMLDALDSPRAVIIGHSLGGMVAQSFAANYPARTAALVLSGTSPAFGKADGGWQQAFLASRLAPVDAGTPMSAIAASIVPAMLGDEPDPIGRDAALRAMSAVPPATYRSALHALVAFDRRADLPNIACPTLVLAGARDGNAPPSMMRRMCDKIAHAQYVEMQGVGHLANMERPAVFNAAIDAFLTQHFPR